MFDTVLVMGRFWVGQRIDWDGEIVKIADINIRVMRQEVECKIIVQGKTGTFEIDSKALRPVLDCDQAACNVVYRIQRDCLPETIVSGYHKRF